MWLFGIFYGMLLVYFVVIWYIFSVLVFCTKKYLATLHTGAKDSPLHARHFCAGIAKREESEL
jgi:hypothetical protein